MALSKAEVSFFSQSSFEQRLDYRLKQAGIKPAHLLFSQTDRETQYDRFLDLLGNTPVLRHSHYPSLILVKDLSAQPSECHYDEAYTRTLRQLEEKGIIWPTNQNQDHGGKRVELIEVTSGSAGISFALVCNVMGFEGTIFVPEDLPPSRIHPMKALGLNVVLTPRGDYVLGASQKLFETIQEYKAKGYETVLFNRGDDRPVVLEELEKDKHRVCIVNHSENKTTVEAFGRVGTEMANYLPEGVSPDFALFITGNFTTIVGMGSKLKEKYPNIKIIGLEDMTNPNHFTSRYPGEFEKQYGFSPTFEQPRVYGSSQRGVRLFFEKQGLTLLDQIMIFDPNEAINYQAEYNDAQNRSSEESIGRSSAASLLIAERLADENPGSIIWTLRYDKGDRYDYFVPAVDPLLMADAVKSGRFQPSRIKPLGWIPSQPETPTDIPMSLEMAYAQ